jgi:hypothetical protein
VTAWRLAQVVRREDAVREEPDADEPSSTRSELAGS